MKAIYSKVLGVVLLVLLSQGFSTWASSGISLFDGKIMSPKSNGFYDLRIKVWDKSKMNNGKNFQTIDMPKVQVKDGNFTVDLDAGLSNTLEKNISLKIESRRFESWNAFEPAELSNFIFRVEKKSKQPQLSFFIPPSNQAVVVLSKP